MSCHGCAYEWANACNEHKVHFPSNAEACKSCRRNPNPENMATGDHYTTVDQILKRC